MYGLIDRWGYVKKIFKNEKMKIFTTITLSLLFFTFINCTSCLSANLSSSDGYFKLLPMTVEPRNCHTATLLKDGRVLITGGGKLSSGFLKSAEIYDPKTNKFTKTGDMTVPRVNHAAVLLQDGKVLITGGYFSNNGGPLKSMKSAEIYNPKTGKFTKINDMNHAWDNHNMILLNDGRVLISKFSPVLEIFDPNKNEFKDTIPCLTNGSPDTSTLLKDGNVLLASGFHLYKSLYYNPQIFDLKTEKFRFISQMAFSRSFSTATLLKNGEVIIIGGNGSGNGYVKESEIYNPKSDNFRLAAALNQMRSWHSSILLQNGKVLVVGGQTDFDEELKSLKSAELYEPQDNRFIKIGNMHYIRTKPTLTLLKNGNVLIISNGKRPELFVNR